MGWDHLERQRKLARVGEYRPEVYRVTVHDTFDQFHLQMAAGAIRNGMSIAEFLLFAAHYVLQHHRQLRHVQRIFRKGAQEILSAVRKPIGPEYQEPESERDRRRRTAFTRFQERAWKELSRPEEKS
jgi:hypothetical protein